MIYSLVTPVCVHLAMRAQTVRQVCPVLMIQEANDFEDSEIFTQQILL